MVKNKTTMPMYVGFTGIWLVCLSIIWALIEFIMFLFRHGAVPIALAIMGGMLIVSGLLWKTIRGE